ncbi:uncharacterized protein LOC112679969 [Sipha flava]|uniref:Uncharacterized protein LOC112679969 n=1 Tax=Sipha flava TaxID=143950 RepID=A0A8B8F4J1_9HEMI|nr:uncharacterized protein LOC112679969 [Sipha flava]
MLHRFKFILKLLLGHYSSLFNAKPNSEEQTDSLGKSPTQNVCFDFEISNILIKILPICHAPSSYKNKKCSSIIDNFPEALVGIYKLRGSIKIDKSTTCNDIEERKYLKFNLIANKLEAKVYKSNITHSLLKINTIEWKKLENYCIENISDSLLNIDNVKFESSKDNYLLFYYIIHSLITKSQCDQMYTDDCFINSELLQSNLDFIVLFWEIKDIRICCILQKQSSNFDITVKNISANTIKLNDNNQFCSKIITLKSNKLGDIIHPILHIIVQIPSENVTQMSLLFIKTAEIAINIDPLFFEWLVYAPDYRENPIDSLACLDNRVENDLSYNLSVEDQLENKPKRFHWFEKLESTAVFIEFSAVTLNFPNDVLSIAEISFIDEKIDMKRWLEILSDHNIDVLVMSISRLTINCAIESQQVENYFDEFPVNFPESLWSSYSNFRFLFSQ